MKRSITIFIACLMSLLPFTKTKDNTDDKQFLQPLLANKAQETKRNEDSKEVLFSYMDILGYYYDLVAKKVNKPTKTFDEFVADFYADENDLNLLEYTYLFSNKNNVNSYELTSNITDNTSFFKEAETMSLRSSSSSDADYILSSNTYSYTPQSEFKRAPYVTLFNYSSLQTGDIVYETETAYFNAGHTAMIINMSKPGYYGNYMQTIEAVSSGVQYGFLDDLRMAEYKIKILRAQGSTSSIVSNAVYFMTSQIGKSYWFDMYRLNTDINSSYWYCSELVYAAYKYAGIDIGVKQGLFGLEYLLLGCLPSDIFNSINTYEIPLTFYGFLDLSIIGKSGVTWSIRIYNTCSFSTTVYYNKYMCSGSDAEHWTGLGNNVKSIFVYSHSFVTVSINENWFATHITTSYKTSNNAYRIISYADGLNASTHNLNIHHNVLEL